MDAFLKISIPFLQKASIGYGFLKDLRDWVALHSATKTWVSRNSPRVKQMPLALLSLRDTRRSIGKDIQLQFWDLWDTDSERNARYFGAGSLAAPIPFSLFSKMFLKWRKRREEGYWITCYIFKGLILQCWVSSASTHFSYLNVPSTLLREPSIRCQ